MSKAVESVGAPLRAPTGILLMSLLVVGCGRVGFDLLPLAEDGGGAPASHDGGARDGSDGGSASGDTGGRDPADAAPLDPGETDLCIRGECASDADRCPATARDWGGVCGCQGSDVDSDQDGTPDCADLCAGRPDRVEGGACGCDAASEDADGDGVENCNDLCLDDDRKTLPGICGCGLADTDRDDDGMADCADPCPDDPDKIDPGACGCGVPDGDMDDDGILDCVDTCGGLDDASYEPDDTCGVGYCAENNTPSSCVDGVETDCQPAAPLDTNDDTADGVDDDCDGEVDEDACVPRTDTYGPGSYSFSPPPHCTTMTIKLWGGAGASGGADGGYWGIGTRGGHGGAGGFAGREMAVTDTSVIELYVGQGGLGCGTAGSNADPTLEGGNGATAAGDNGSDGDDGSQPGGLGGDPGWGGQGGRGSYGGGGGGAGTDLYSRHGRGGGGGAATVLFLGGIRTLAGGGGGGGGAGSLVSTAGYSGGDGGSGCAISGSAETSYGGGGGGGGICHGLGLEAGTGRFPHDPEGELPGGVAQGGDGTLECDPGGDGYALVSYGP